MARQKKLTRKEKIALSPEIPEEVVEETEGGQKVFSPLPPEELGITDKNVVKKILIYSEEDVWDNSWTHPKTYYIVNGMGMNIYFKTNSRATAQSLANEIYGEGMFTVRKAIKAQLR